MGMLEDLTELLIDRGFDMADVVRGPETDSPDSQTALVPYDGAPSPRTYCGMIYESHQVAIRVRRVDGVEARNRAQALFEDFAEISDAVAGDSVFKEIIASAPAWKDEDQNGRSIYGLNVEIRRRENVGS